MVELFLRMVYSKQVFLVPLVDNVGNEGLQLELLVWGLKFLIHDALEVDMLATASRRPY